MAPDWNDGDHQHEVAALRATIKRLERELTEALHEADKMRGVAVYERDEHNTEKRARLKAQVDCAVMREALHHAQRVGYSSNLLDAALATDSDRAVLDAMETTREALEHLSTAHFHHDVFPVTPSCVPGCPGCRSERFVSAALTKLHALGDKK